MTKNIIIITGFTASGKSVLAESVCVQLKTPLVSTSKILFELATTKGYQNIDSFVYGIPQENFRELFDAYLLENIEKTALNNDCIIIDGLVSITLLDQLRKKKTFRITIMYIEVPEKERIRRTVERDKIEAEAAANKNNKKDTSKKSLGIERVKARANFTLDGTLPQTDLLNKTLSIINTETINSGKEPVYSFTIEFLLFNVIITLLMCLAMNITAFLLKHHGIVSLAFLSALSKSYIIGFIAGVIIPVNSINKSIALKLGIPLETVRFNMIQGFNNNFIFTTIIGASMVLLDTGFSSVFFNAFLVLYFKLLLVGLLVGCFAAPVSMKTTKWLIHKTGKKD